MKKTLFLLLLSVLAGCLSPVGDDVNYHTIDYLPQAAVRSAAPKYGALRISQILVRPPFDRAEFVVLRGNGTVAFDPCNEFAATPSLLLRGPVFDALNSSSIAAAVVGSGSLVRASRNAEILVTRLCLDCTKAGERTAVAELAVRIVGDGEIVSIGKGAANISAADGDYSRAFSQAVSAALEKAINSLVTNR